jgi:ketosteroid isomerase-like protein
MNNLDLVRKYYSCYETKDRKTLEQLLSDDFVFDSPVDDHIDKATYMRKCWPNSEQIEASHFTILLAAEENLVLSRYTVDWKAD